MPYEVYKLIHIVSIFLFISSLGALFFGNKESKLHKILSGVVSLMILVAGMGLLARLNYNHGEPWPLWVKMKIALWMLAAILLPVLNKRVTQKRGLAFSLIMIILSLAAYVAIYKPFM